MNKKEEDIIAKQQVCVNCDSLLNPNTPDFCFQCGTQFDRRPNATVPNLAINPNEKNQQPVVKEAYAERVVEAKEPIQMPEKSIADQAREKILSQDIPQREKADQAQKTDDKDNKEDQVSDLLPSRWSERMKIVLSKCNFSGKEKKVCQKCQRVYPFFKTECNHCQYKFPKTRHGASTSIQTENYTLQFWNKLRNDIALFDSLT